MDYKVAPGKGLGLLVMKAKDDGGLFNESMVVKGFNQRNTAFQKRGVRPGDVVVAVGSWCVEGSSYAEIIKMVGEAKARGQISLTFLSVSGYSIAVPEKHVSVGAAA